LNAPKEPPDPDGRIRVSEADPQHCTCGIVTEADVRPVIGLLTLAFGVTVGRID
jgi:hypothetical protein